MEDFLVKDDENFPPIGKLIYDVTTKIYDITIIVCNFSIVLIMITYD